MPAGLTVVGLGAPTCCSMILEAVDAVTQSAGVNLLGGVAPADLVEQHSALHHRPVELVNKLTAETEPPQLPQEEHPLTRSLAACVHVRSPLQPAGDHHSQVLVPGHSADYMSLDDDDPE